MSTALSRKLARRTVPRAPRAMPVPEQSAFLDRQFESIAAAEHKDPKTGEISRVEKQVRVVTLVDQLQKEKSISMPLHRAAEYYRELAAAAAGSSQGVSRYGEFEDSAPANQRCLVNDKQMSAAQEFKAASFAAFGTPTQDGRQALDEQLIQLVLPALFSSKKGVTKVAIGTPRTKDTGHGQRAAVGKAIVIEVLHRLALHFGYIQR